MMLIQADQVEMKRSSFGKWEAEKYELERELSDNKQTMRQKCVINVVTRSSTEN